MVSTSFLKATALLAGLAASVSGLSATHFQSNEAKSLVKRATELGNTGITYDIVEDGLSTSVTFAVDYDEVIVVKGYVVSSEFTLSASDAGFAVSASYDNATQFCEEADMWMAVYSYDGSTPALIAPDCSNVFTLLDADGSVIDWTAGGCISIGSLAAANPVCAEVSASSTASTVASATVTNTGAVTSAEPTTYSEIVITETASGVTTVYTTYCPLSSGTPDYDALSTSYVTVSEGVTTTVTEACSACAAAASSAAAAASETGSLFVETTYVTGTVTVTSLVPCPTTAAAAAAEPTTYTEIIVTKTVEGTSTVYTTYCPLSSGTPVYDALSTSYVTVTEDVTTTVTEACSACAAEASSAAAANTASGEAKLYVASTLTSGTVTVTTFVTATTGATVAPVEATTTTTPYYTTYTTEGVNGDDVVVTSVVSSPTVSAVVASSTSAVAAVGDEGAAGSATASSISVYEGAAPMKFASSGLVGAAIAMLLL